MTKTIHGVTLKTKILNLLLLITSLLGYLEWGGNNHMFLFAAESEIVSKLFTDPKSVLHPFILLPLLGQLLLVFTLFQKTPSTTITYISIAGLGLLLGLMFIIGLISLNVKMILSTIPFIVVAFLTVKYVMTKAKAPKE